VPIAVGETAPEFTLAGTGGREYTLSELRGRTVVLVFYPGDGTPVCTRQLNDYNRELGRLTARGADVLAISPQTVESHEQFARAEGGFGFPLLSDADKSAGRAYGIIGPLGFYRRSVFVIDGDGVVRWRHSGLTGVTFQPLDAIEEAVAALT
jgi:peroxiredoxin Q/BCP